MLKNIPSILSPTLLKVLCEMGHSDEIVLADGNFPSETMGKQGIVVRADGHDIPSLLRAILPLFPLDQYVKQPVGLMQVAQGDPTVPAIFDCYREILSDHHYDEQVMEYMDRFSFYERAKTAYAVIATGETALYGNILLKKGVIQ